MELLILMAVIFIVFRMTSQFHKDVEYDNKVEIKVKECPPHAWFWQEVVDQNGARVGERIVCKRCGPLSNSLNGGNNE